MEKNSTLFYFTSSVDCAKDLSTNHPHTSDNFAVPTNSVIQNILNYSKALRINKSKAVGIIENVLN